jgi:uncharacterized membrane protein
MIESAVTIRRPVGEVFGFYRDFTNLPKFLGDVMAVELTDPVTCRWTIQGPLGIRINWTIRVTEERPNELIRDETTSLPGLKTGWTIQFTPKHGGSETEVREVMNAPLGQLTPAVLALIGKPPAKEVAANLHRFKELIEDGKVSDTSYSVPGKFAQRRDD